MFVAKPRQELDSVVLESELKGKTLLIYWYLLQQPSHSVGIREVQRALGFSSPSIAVHHLEKLQDLGLIDKKGTGEYVLQGEVKVGILRFFTRVGRFLVPRYLFYSVLFSTMLIAYSALCIVGLITASFYALMFGFIAVLVFWVETFRLWRARPF
jgi:predicted DNA-binding transcriptional regulator